MDNNYIHVEVHEICETVTAYGRDCPLCLCDKFTNEEVRITLERKEESRGSSEEKNGLFVVGRGETEGFRDG